MQKVIPRLNEKDRPDKRINQKIKNLL